MVAAIVFNNYKRCLQTLLHLFHTEDCDIKNKQEQWLNCAICWLEWNKVSFIQSLELYICRILSFCKSSGHRNNWFFWFFRLREKKCRDKSRQLQTTIGICAAWKIPIHFWAQKFKLHKFLCSKFRMKSFKNLLFF